MGNENKSADSAKPQIDVSQWLQDAQLTHLLDTFEQLGEVRFIGGAVRDLLVGLAPSDLDIGTTAPPDIVLSEGVRAGFRMIPTGLAHGTVTAVLERGPVEITTLRRDIATDGRHATVAFTNDWTVDASRRDFTINALSATRDGEVFDYHGGLNDLAAHRVRFIGNAVERISEDYLRAFRLFRFSARYADTLDQDALVAVRQNLSGVKKLSGERIASELLKLLAGPRADVMWQQMIDAGLLAACIPDAVDAARLSRVVGIEGEMGMPDPLRRLRAALTRGGTVATAVAKRLKLGNEQRKRLIGIADAGDLLALLNDGNFAEALYRHDRQLVIDEAILAIASDLLPISSLRELLSTTLLWIKPVFPLGGENLMELGLKPGPIFGALLHDVEEWWITQRFRPTRQECFAELKQIWKARKTA